MKKSKKVNTKKQTAKNRRKTGILTLLIALFFAPCLLAQQTELAQQTAAYEIDSLLQTSAITYAQAARFILEASDRAVFTDPEEAFRYAQERNWFGRNVTAEQTARLDVVSKLIMSAFEIRGGLLFSITGRPRYAYRELVYLNIIQGRTEPGLNVSGELLLFITGRILTNHQGVVQ
ncbi:MAG: hypothetical protein FWC97_07395 [Treponema sp.]|nr:hypothetical protein [Treponema sp.]